MTDPEAKKFDEPNPASRRDFIKGSSMLLAGGAIPTSLPRSNPTTIGAEPIRLGLIGCGGRGTALALQALNPVHGEVRLVTVGDVFEDRLQQAMRALRSGPNRDRVEVEPQRRFVGLEAYRKVVESDIDLVILAAPPGFRPLHFAAAVAAGKHVLAEKPIATDAPCVRQFLATCQEASDRKLAVAVGLQRRHEPAYQAIIAKLQAGAIGRINFCRAYWNQSTSWSKPRLKQQTELEYQLRNWTYFNWLSGDHIVEQHVHNLDVINWLLDGHPERAQGAGGRQVRTSAEFGQVYDHHTVEFTYRSGVKLLSMCRQMPNCWNAVGEFAHGSEGWADIAAGRILDLDNQVIWEADSARRGHAGELESLFAALRSGIYPNEGYYAAESTMTAIMGRMATYSGKEVTWSRCLDSSSSLADVAALRTLRDTAPCLPDVDGRYSVAQPGIANSKDA
jgi:myo-inositol 2-dehydrogenase / D-chiro-inositol 1-dehydrogenase